ncbi:MAG: TonB family protein [Pseudomonadota bacterium]
MALEQFKTQVLLLHSEQSTLDSLSTGFTDKYAVHCATSGIEALNTLGATPIDVIVSAQELAGMSGLDALREAKKRSPDTIAILMAGTDTSDGLEAMVSEKEVFQVIRGEIAPDALRELVDSATKSARLMALAESANDTSADGDGSGEHIVMETADNGSFIISDGTGQLPVLKPEKVGSAPTTAGNQVDVLVLTQDEEFLATIKESSLGTHHVHHAVKPGDAETLMKSHPVGVLVTDAAMAGANVEALAQRMRTHCQRLVAIVAGRRDDGEMLMDLINRGQVYRFLLKPVSPGRARLAIEASVKHHLEAPDQAFKPRTGAAPAAKPRPKAAPKPATPKAAAAAPKKPSAKVSRPPEIEADNVSPTTDGLDDAFDEANSFTETMTGIATSVSKTISNAAGSIKAGRNDAERSGAPSPTSSLSDAGDTGGIVNPKTMGIAAAVVVVVLVGIFALSGGDDAPVEPIVATEQETPDSSDPPIVPDITPAEPEPEPALAPAVSGLQTDSVIDDAVLDTTSPAEEPAAAEPDNAEPVEAVTVETVDPVVAPEPSGPDTSGLLQQARDARAAGDVFSPAGNNAVEYYLAARDLAPGDATISEELAATIAEVYGLAENALLAGESTDASRALRILNLADAGNPRITFLTTQLTQLELRGALDSARAAIRDSRFEDAGRELARAESVIGDSSPEIDALSAELAAARDARQLEDVLAVAGERLAADQLLEPADDSASHYYNLALSIDAKSTPAQQGLLAIASKLVLRARTAIDGGDLAGAENILNDARALDPNSAEVAAAAEALRVAAEPPPAPTAAPAEAAPATAAATLDDSAGSSAVAEPAQPETVSITALRRTKYTPPRYPRAAQRRDQSGYVDVIFTVSPLGSVSAVEVFGAEPEGVFDEAAMEAVLKWEFEPVVENGTPVSKRVAVRMSFNLQ